jgi:hypothetical protein
MTAPPRNNEGSGGDVKLYWGDIHNHNAVGYARGTLERSIDIARNHLDFFAFTGHAAWHDMPKMPGDRHLKWVQGFEVHSRHWPKTRQLIKAANDDSFVAFLGYEWHSSAFGDYCIIFPEDRPELYLPDHVNKLFDFAKEKGALAIPHHVAYKTGWRGISWDYFRPDVIPVVEVYSEHGCTISDRSPYPMIRNSMGGRSTANTIHVQLNRGRRFGFTASTDDHLGFPGGYGEGLLGVWAEALTPAAIFEAIRRRRTVAATGDRISLNFTLNGHSMGSEIPDVEERDIRVEIDAPDSLEMVELIRNGRTIERHFPEDAVTLPFRLPNRVKCRIQYGWGPWAVLGLGRTCSWNMNVVITGGRFVGATGYYQSGPFNEDFIDNMTILSDREIRLDSFTSREGCKAEDPTKSVVLDIEADPDARLIVTLNEPVRETVEVALQDLVEDNLITFTGVFTSESFIIHRPVFPDEYAATIRWHDRVQQKQQPDWYYIRAKAHNGHMAWSSPIWVG